MLPFPYFSRKGGFFLSLIELGEFFTDHLLPQMHFNAFNAMLHMVRTPDMWHR